MEKSAAPARTVLSTVRGRTHAHDVHAVDNSRAVCVEGFTVLYTFKFVNLVGRRDSNIEPDKPNYSSKFRPLSLRGVVDSVIVRRHVRM